ncbi:hypothetical protein AVEN_110460-1 [Araneus ventricosus]|uniref:Uncharacterized protein n=1 Tax=Araneus ventricosus TaxID=182803 RepID=A0A4Y2WRV3_ARAVE|nr:hypothetical protein AVEN_110460-1 [Araneus ventricosus]
MQEKGESLMVQYRGCRSGDPISSIPGDECIPLCSLLCAHYCKPLEAYCHSCSLVISVRSFGTNLYFYPAWKSSLSERPAKKSAKNRLKKSAENLKVFGTYFLLKKCRISEENYVPNTFRSSADFSAVKT